MGLNLDATTENADWPKRSWDLHTITSADQLRAVLAARGMTVEQFMRLPIYRLNVDTLPWLRDLNKRGNT